MGILQVGLIVTTLLCSLVAGLVFTFAIVAMPGIGTLSDRDFLQSFRAMDRVIQNNQPVFMLVWVGSIVTLVATSWIGFRQLVGIEQIVLVLAAVIYLVGVQVPTFTFNVPLNNQVQALDIATLDEQAAADARRTFEAPWTRWNTIRTAFASLTVVMLVFVALRL